MRKSYRFFISALWLANLIAIQVKAAPQTKSATPAASLKSTRLAPAKKTTTKIAAKRKTTTAAKTVAAPKPKLSARRVVRSHAPAPVAKFPTYGDPTLDDDATRDDPVVRAA